MTAVVLVAGAVLGQGFLGVQTVPGRSPLNGALGQTIQAVVPGSAAEAAQLLPRDVIVSVTSGRGITLITSTEALRQSIQLAGGGAPVTLEVHTPFGPWQVEAVLDGGVTAYGAAPGRAGVRSSGPGGAGGGLRLTPKQARPGGYSGPRSTSTGPGGRPGVGTPTTRPGGSFGTNPGVRPGPAPGTRPGAPVPAPARPGPATGVPR